LGASLRLRAPVTVLLSDEVSVPETFGWRAPVIVLPLAARQWPLDRLRLVLLHELFHIKRHDWGVHLLAVSPHRCSGSIRSAGTDWRGFTKSAKGRVMTMCSVPVLFVLNTRAN
jgi:hypothetical protein